MIHDNNGWMVGVRTDHMMRFDTVVIGRDIGDHRTEYLTKITADAGEISTTDDRVASPHDAELKVPHGVLQAIADHLKPGPGSGEVKRLEEALKLERSRVEKLIDAHLGTASPTI